MNAWWFRLPGTLSAHTSPARGYCVDVSAWSLALHSWLDNFPLESDFLFDPRKTPTVHRGVSISIRVPRAIYDVQMGG